MYAISASPGGLVASVDAAALQSPDEFLLQGLTNGTSYTFTITARNAIGDGPASAPTSPITAQTAFPWGNVLPPEATGYLNVITPSSGAVYSLGQQVTLDFEAVDASAIFLTYTLLDGVVVQWRDFDPFNTPTVQLDTSTTGLHTLVWVVYDVHDNVTSDTRTYCVETIAEPCSTPGDLPPTDISPSGGTVTTDPASGGATTEVPVQTAIAVPPSDTGGTVEVTSGPVSDPAPTGYSFLGSQVTITSTVVGSVSSPLVLTFTIEGTTPGADPSTLSIVRTESGNSVTLPLCTGAFGTASPDPCMTPPSTIISGPAAGDIQVSVYTTHASDWNFAVHAPYAVAGFYQPVDNRPVLNTTSGGSAIPVKFSLGGDKGLTVFGRGYPTSGTISCSSDTTIDAIEQTVTASASGLTYDSKSGQYTYTWKTQKSWGGTCRQLELKFNDGSIMRADFKFK